jgi:hypothetical protein
MVIYSATLLTTALFSATAFGFEYRAETKPKQKNDFSAQAIGSGQEYCLVFEDHFDTFDLKNWQVKTKDLFIN